MNSFKAFLFSTLTILVFAIPPAALADGVNESAVQNEGLLRDLKQLARKCVVEPYIVNGDGEKVFGELRSICDELQPSTGGGVRIEIKGHVFHAVIIESEDSDGGDLDHLLVMNGKGAVVASRYNILAFNNIYIALAGGDTGFRQVRVN